MIHFHYDWYNFYEIQNKLNKKHEPKKKTPKEITFDWYHWVGNLTWIVCQRLALIYFIDFSPENSIVSIYSVCISSAWICVIYVLVALLVLFVSVFTGYFKYTHAFDRQAHEQKSTQMRFYCMDRKFERIKIKIRSELNWTELLYCSRTNKRYEMS